MSRHIKGVIFDLDGTLIDSMKSWENADIRFLRENNIPVPPGISEVMKRLSMKEAAQYFIDLGVRMPHDRITERIEQMVYEEYSSSISLKEYVTELLDVLEEKNIRFCVATANYRSLTDVILRRYDIYDRFSFIYTCAENGIKKDDPSFFENVSRILGTSPEETAVLDDSLHCIESAHRSGFFSVAVYDSSSSDWEETSRTADLSIKSLQEFAEFISEK